MSIKEFGSAGAGSQPVIQAAYSIACVMLTAMARAALPGIICLTLVACGPAPSVLEQVQQQNELIVITRNGPTTFYEGPAGPTGFEYELASLFADYIGVELRMLVPPSFSDILPLTALGDAHFAAAGLTVTEKRKKKVHLNGTLEIVKGSSHEERLITLKKEYPDLSWQANAQQSSEELLVLVWQQLIEYTIADSNELSVNRHYYPELKPAFDINTPEPLAWAFPHSDDNSLFNTAVFFFNKIKANGILDGMIERHYGHIGKFDYVGTRRYQAHVEQRLPLYKDTFIEAADEIGMDWRLLAAVGYQESHWEPDAVSPTGVRGLMMLTKDAAKDIGITDREDPEQSIRGGAKYLANMIQRIPERIPEPDRTWLGLAAYNVGLGHLEDARILTQKNKGDFDRWVDVKENLPLLSKKKWFQQTRYGYARGREPVRYVENVRTYYDILVWLTEQEALDAAVPQEAPQFDSPAL